MRVNTHVHTAMKGSLNADAIEYIERDALTPIIVTLSHTPIGGIFSLSRNDQHWRVPFPG